MKHALLAGAAGTLAALAIVSAAFGAKPERNVIDVDCGSDGTFQVVSYGDQGQSNFAPAHIVGTNKVIIPVAFSNVSGTFTDTDGTVHPFQDDDISRHAPVHVTLLDCHFSIDGSDGHGGTFSVAGDVTAYIPGK